MYHGSHDAFVFSPPMPRGFSAKLDFYQNRISAENVVIYEFRNLKRQMLQNPCFQLKIFHLHCTQERQYEELSISRGKGRIGEKDRHKDAYPRYLDCPKWNGTDQFIDLPQNEFYSDVKKNMLKYFPGPFGVEAFPQPTVL
jgi:hypothetical protein